MALKKPMLATDAPATIKFPVYASYKLDGLRATVQGGQFVSRSLKPFPNKFLQSNARPEMENLDGELIVGPANSPNVFQQTNSGIMSIYGEPDYTFRVFDFLPQTGTDAVKFGYKTRFENLFKWFNLPFNDALLHCDLGGRLALHPHVVLSNQEELDCFEASALEAGYEGVIVRKLDSAYKHGRSTEKQGYMLKVKRFTDAEAVVVGFDELMHNANEKTINELGYSQRSSHGVNKVPMGTLGALQVKDTVTGVVFNIGTGYSAAVRKEIWDHREFYLNKLVKYKSFPIGVKDKPRHPVFLGFRHEDDLS